MQFEENHTQHTYNLTGCGNGYLEINGEQIGEPVFLTGEVLEKIAPLTPQELSTETFLNAMTAHNERPEVILVGTGDKQIFLHPRIAAQLAREGIGLESMNTAAACRTRMVLESEGRRVWAWLWP